MRDFAPTKRGFVLLLCLLLLPALTGADEGTARRLINAQGCKGCHSLEGSGGNRGPALDGVGRRLTADQIERQLLNPKARNPDSIMPRMTHLSAENLKALVDFLSSRK
ncbi:cytochrome c [Desulfuromonas sp. KJ2020]|uniref:c-type cytochrome n=1 Tax=Desulfuromonas sp. KJ2020 TaxID=2919173 RepID=UPI0020A7A0D7|nr:c-type cytochrome [Desulfuromonas sp. KJ2020]MCP3176785.1 cytochrome c [Desulfuromonas sp. KJ2020]